MGLLPIIHVLMVCKIDRVLLLRSRPADLPNLFYIDPQHEVQSKKLSWAMSRVPPPAQFLQPA
jgi:hypothetical protein